MPSSEMPVRTRWAACQHPKVGPGRLPPMQFPSQEAAQEWKEAHRWDWVVPVNWLDEQGGPSHSVPGLQEFLALARVGAIAAADSEAIQNARTEAWMSPPITCDLAEDWQFDRLQVDAGKHRTVVWEGGEEFHDLGFTIAEVHYGRIGRG